MKTYQLSLINGHMPHMQITAPDARAAHDKAWRLCQLIGWRGFSKDLLVVTEVA